MPGFNPRSSHTDNPSSHHRWIAAAALLLSVFAGSAIAGTSRVSAAPNRTAVWKVYAPGWNLVGAPGGANLSPHGETLLSLDELAAQYGAVRDSSAQAGAGYWVYYPFGATLLLIGIAQDVTSVHIDGGHWGALGNSGTRPAVVRGADMALVFDPISGWASATSVQPGQAALVYANTDADAFLDPYSTYQPPLVPIMAQPSGVTPPPPLPAGQGAPASATPTEELTYLIALGPLLSDVDARLSNFADGLEAVDSARPDDPLWQTLRTDQTSIASDLLKLRSVPAPERYVAAHGGLLAALADINDGMRDTLDGLLGHDAQRVTLGAGLLASGARRLLDAESGLPQ